MIKIAKENKKEILSEEKADNADIQWIIFIVKVDDFWKGI